MLRDKRPKKVHFRNLSSFSSVVTASGAFVIFLLFFLFKETPSASQCNASLIPTLPSLANYYEQQSSFDGTGVGTDSPGSALLVISLNFKEEESWLKEWLIRTSHRLKSLPFGVIISAATTHDIESLKKVVATVTGPSFVLFSEPFAKCKIGPFLLEGHRRNLELALKHTSSRKFTHAMLLASNCAFVRDVTAEKRIGAVQLTTFVEKNPAVFGAVSTPWHWAPAVFNDGCLYEWRRRVDKAVICEDGSICALGKAPKGLAISENGLFAAVSEGLVASHDAVKKLLPLLSEYMNIKLSSSSSSARFKIAVGRLIGGFWSVKEDEQEYPAEEVVLSTSVALISTRRGPTKKSVLFSHTLRAFFEFGRAVEFTPTKEELQALMNDPEGLLLAKRVPRDPKHPLWRLAAGEVV